MRRSLEKNYYEIKNKLLTNKCDEKYAKRKHNPKPYFLDSFVPRFFFHSFHTTIEFNCICFICWFGAIDMFWNDEIKPIYDGHPSFTLKINWNSPAWSVGQSNPSNNLICLRSKYAGSDWHMHWFISVVFSNSTLFRLQYGENCCGVICCIWLNEIFNSTKSGRIPKFGTDDNRQLAKYNFFNGAATGFFKSCNIKSYGHQTKWHKIMASK